MVDHCARGLAGRLGTKQEKQHDHGFEVGRSLIGRLGVYVRPGIGVWGRDVIGAYDWNIEGGIRYMFPSF